MAPRMPRDYHSAADPNSYSPRTRAKRGEDHLPRSRDANGQAVSGKEGFLRSIGLQMRRYQYEYDALGSVHGTRRINVPCGVRLRDCSVVIPGATCRVCGKTFKCVTDVNVHAAWKHVRRETDGGVAVNGDGRTREATSPRHVERATVPAAASPGARSTGKLRLTLRIGAEVVGQRTVKRKHLRASNRTHMATQTDAAHSADGLNLRECEDAVPRIDLPVSDNSPCRCCTPTMHVGNSTNRYLAGNIVASKDTECVANVAAKGCPVLDRLTGSCATSTGEEVNGVHDHPSNVKFGSTVTRTVEGNDTASMVDSRDVNPDELSTRQDPSAVGDLYDNSWVASWNSAPSGDAGIVRYGKGVLSEQTVRSPERDINGNEKPRGSPSEKRDTKNSGVASSVIVPVIIPIIVSNSCSPAADKAQHRPGTRGHRRNSTPAVAAERSVDDDVQEVLRIVRGHANSEEINHESPNRSEQEMLVRDAIRDMLRMEEQGWHLLEKDAEPSRKRRRAAAKSDTRNGTANEDTGKRRKRATAQPGFDGNVIRSVANERHVSSARELFAKAQKPNQTRVCITDSVKENVMICNGNISVPCNGNINVPSEVLHCYGINYYNETFEINNNTETVQGPVSRFLVPCSGGTENKSNRPAVIDLVNDTDE